jgi:hypothetical protein
MILQYKHMTSLEMEEHIPEDRIKEQIKHDIIHKIAEALYEQCDIQTEIRPEGTVRFFEIVTIPPTNFKRIAVLLKQMWYYNDDQRAKEMINLLHLDKMVP